MERCPLLGGNFKKIVTFGLNVLFAFMACPLFGMSGIRGVDFNLFGFILNETYLN